MKHYLIKYQAGTSPYWYQYQTYTHTEQEALAEFDKYNTDYPTRNIIVSEIPI